MKKQISLSLISSLLLIASSPIHDLMDNRIKGKSFGGSTDDNIASEDGIGIIPLQHHTGTSEINNELTIQKIFNSINKRETDILKTKNIRESVLNGSVSTVLEQNILNQVGFQLNYSSGSLSSCQEIKTLFPTSTSGDYLLSNGWTAKCDMTTGNEIYNNNLNTCKEIKEKIPNSTDGYYSVLTLGNVYCDMTTDNGGWTRISSTTITNGKYGSTKVNYPAKEFMGKYTGMIYYNHYGPQMHTHQQFDVFISGVEKTCYWDWNKQEFQVTNDTIQSPVYNYYRPGCRFGTANYEKPTPSFFKNTFNQEIQKNTMIYFGDFKNLNNDYSWDSRGYTGSMTVEVFFR